MTNIKSFDLATFDNLGNDYIKSQADAKQGKAQSTSLQASLSWLTLAILLSGKLQDVQHMQNVFSKEGKFHNARMVYTRAKAVAKELNAKQSIEIKTKKESFVFTIKEVLASPEQMLFNVSTAYNSLDKENTLTEEEKAIQAFIEAKGMTKKGFEEMTAINASFKEEAIAQGLVILDDLAKNTAKDAIPAMCETIREQFAALKALDDDTAYLLIQGLINDYQEAIAA